MASAETIAAAMADNPDALADHLGEFIKLEHAPPSPIDGVVSRDFFAQAIKMTREDPSRDTKILSIVVDGDKVIQKSIVTTRGEAGMVEKCRHTSVFTIADGKVVDVYSHYEPILSSTHQTGTAVNVAD
jgi:predicted SnoaL-like aldol condensation-catalyzing enzyme